MTHVLYASKDHGSLERPGKHKPGQLICIKDKENFSGWGRREVPERGYGSIEVAGARKWQIMPFMEPLLNYPSFDWGIHGNHTRVNVMLPPWYSLKDHEEHFLRELFPNTMVGTSPYGCVIDLYTEQQVRGFKPYFDREFVDKLQKKEGPRYVLNPRTVQQIAWDGGCGKCDLATFKRNMSDRTVEAMDLAA